MKLLTPGTGNQKANQGKAIQYIAENNILDVAKVDWERGNITTMEGKTYHVSAYAETSAAFVSTPGVDRSKNSIYAPGLPLLLFRQLKNDSRSFIYEVMDPNDVVTKPNSSSAEWQNIEKVSCRRWICTEKDIRRWPR